MTFRGDHVMGFEYAADKTLSTGDDTLMYTCDVKLGNYANFFTLLLQLSNDGACGVYVVLYA